MTLLREAVTASGLSQAAFARALSTSAPRLSTYLTGDTQPSARFLVRTRRPVAWWRLVTGLVAPVPDLFGVYAVFPALAVLVVRLGRRRSWWVLAVPPVTAELWFLLMWIGEAPLGWRA